MVELYVDVWFLSGEVFCKFTREEQILFIKLFLFYYQTANDCLVRHHVKTCMLQEWGVKF